MLRTPAQFSIHKQFYPVKLFFSLFLPQMKRKEEQFTQEGTLKQNQDLPIAGPLTGGDLVAVENSLQMLFCPLQHPKAAPHFYTTNLGQLPLDVCTYFMLPDLNIPQASCILDSWTYYSSGKDPANTVICLSAPAQIHNLSLSAISKTYTVH